MLRTPADVLKFAQEEGVTAVDFKFVDLPGLWHHYTIPLNQLDERLGELAPESWIITYCT